MNVELVPAGFGNFVAVNRVVAITSPGSSPIRHAIKECRARGLLIDLTNGRKTKAVAFADSGHIILMALASITIFGRLQEDKI